MPNFRALKITKHYIVNDITQKITTVEREEKKPLQNYVAGKRRHYHESSHFFESPPPPKKKNRQTNKETKKQKNKNLLTSYLKQATQCKKSRNRKLQTPSTGECPWKIVSLPATQASMVSYYGILKIAVNSCLLYSTCMCDKLATSACGFYLQRAINFISKCGTLSRVLNLAGQWRGSLPRRRF